MADDLTLVARLSANASEFVDAMGKAARAAEGFAKDAQKEFKSVADNLDSMGRQAKDVGLKMGAMGAAIIAPLGLAAKSAGDFGKGMANVAALGVKDLDKLADGVQDLREEFGILEDGTDASYNAISAGVSEAATLGVLEMAAKGARAGVGTLNEALDLGTGMMNSYKWEANSAADEVRNMERAMAIANTAVLYGKTTIAELSSAMGRGMSNFANAGVELEEFASLVAALTTNNVSASEAVTQLNASLNSVYNQSEDAKRIIYGLGLEFNEAALQAKGYSQFWLDVVEQVKAGNPALYAKKKALEEEVSETDKSVQAMEDQIAALREQKRQLSAAKQPTADLADQIAALKKRLDTTKDALSDAKAELKDLSPIQEDANATLVKLVGSQEAFRGVVAVSGPLLEKVRTAMAGMADGVDNLNKSFEASKAADPTVAFNKLSASIKTLSEDVGAAVLESFAPLAVNLSSIVRDIRAWVEENPKLSASIVTVTGSAGGLLVALGGIGFALGGIAQGIAAIAKMGAVVAALIAAWEVLASAVAVVVIALGAFASIWPVATGIAVAAMGWLVYNWRATLTAIWDGLKFLWDTVVGLVAAFLNTIELLLKTVGALFSTLWDVITLDFEGVIETWTGLAYEWYQLFAGWIETIAKKVKGVFNTLGDYTGGVIFKAYDAVFGEAIDERSNPVPNPPPNIPALATGGIVTRPTLAYVGEAGPEAVIPLERMGSITNDNSNVTIQVYGDDPRATAEAVFEIMQRRKLT